MQVPFTKPALTHREQVELLAQRGMVMEDPAEAEFYLRHLNYYRLGAYWLPFEEDHANHRFRAGTSFPQVLELYRFDRELRVLAFDAIERIEVSVRSQWAYALAHHHGPHAHLTPAISANQHHWRQNIDALTEEVDRSQEAFIIHLRTKYVEPLPPVWAACEVMSLGLLSRWYNDLRPMPTRRAIAAPYGLDERVLESWLRHLSLIRNTCAHHGRLWNREFTVTPMIPRSKPPGLGGEFVPGSRRVFNTFVLLLYMLDVIAPDHSWRARLAALIESSGASTHAMGFPKDWKTRSIWKQAWK
jgi:abortive infection bacteriophage resistance protein